MPDPSLLAAGHVPRLPPIGYGLIFVNPVLLVVGLVWLMVVGFFAWILEPVAEGDDDYEPAPLHGDQP
jgi:cytochrome c oxidase subunit I